MSDVLDDRKRDSRFKNVVILLLIVAIAVMAFAFIRISIHCQDKISEQAEQSEKRMYEFLREYDFSGEIDLDTAFNDNNSGNINVTR